MTIRNRGWRDEPGGWRAAFLDALQRTGSVQGAADEAGVERSTPYKYRRRNADFAGAWQKALRARAEVGG